MLRSRREFTIIKRHLISTNRNILPYVIRIRTPGKLKLSFLDLIRGRANLNRRGLEKFKMFTANKQKRHQWQIVEPQQKHKHKIQLVAFEYLCMYLIL